MREIKKSEVMFMGLLYNPDEEGQLIENSSSGLGIASNLLQWNILKGLNSDKDIDLNVLSSLPVGNYPNSNKLFYYPEFFYSYDNVEYINEVRSFNIPILKHKIRYIDFKRRINEWEKASETPKVIICYDLYGPFLNIIKWIKEKDINIKVIIIIPDLVGNLRNDTDAHRIIRMISIMNTKRVMKLLNLADGYILLSQYMHKFIEEKDKPIKVINGVIDKNNFKLSNEHQKANKQRIFMYSGFLSKEYDLDKLVEYFNSRSDQKAILWLCGYGGIEDKLKTKSYKNVIFFGLVPKKELIELENIADVLINPRPASGEYTKYSFPSKNLEYLAQGKPVICYRLPPFSNKYDDAFDYINDYNGGITEVIEKYIDMDKSDIEKIGESNRKFAFTNLDYSIQHKKIKSLINDVLVTNIKS